jgi:hypothetical protein
MSDTPERIWIWPFDSKTMSNGTFFAAREPYAGAPEYIHADLYAQLQAENAALRADTVQPSAYTDAQIEAVDRVANERWWLVEVDRLPLVFDPSRIIAGRRIADLRRFLEALSNEV